MSRHKHILVPEAKDALDSMQNEIESDVETGSLAKVSGSIGGEMTKRLVEIGEEALCQKKKGI